MCDELERLGSIAHYRLTRVWRTYNIAIGGMRLLVSSFNACNNFYEGGNYTDDTDDIADENNLLPLCV